MRRARTVLAIAGTILLGACASGEPRLMNLRNPDPGPDEFAILPPKALTLPTDLASLPVPTPGGGNLTDPTPEADAIVALGGRPDAGAGGAGLTGYTGRFGTDPAIRGELASNDLEFRRNNRGRILERLFNVNSYFRAYSGQSLDQQAELERWRARGARTPSAPPG